MLTVSAAPLLVTGMPRSGTTWLARLLASAPGCALTGREPMNPRGRQYALGGTLSGWARLESPSDRQRRALRTSYLGLNPLVYSRYGHRQWAAPLPRTRIIVKDPFAMLSVPAIHGLTGASAVMLFRHPGASLTSYRRMGWRVDVDELAPIIDAFITRHGRTPGVSAPPQDAGDVEEMTWFWNALYGMALHDSAELGSTLAFVAHEDVAGGGAESGRKLFQHLGLEWREEVADELSRTGSPQRVDANALHNFDRNPAQVAHEWESKVTPDERVLLDEQTAEVYALLRERSLQL